MFKKEMKSVIMTSNGVLKDRIKDSILFISNYEEIGKKIKDRYYTGFLDVLYLFGLSKEKYNKEDDRYMNEEEMKLLSDYYHRICKKEKRIVKVLVREHDKVGIGIWFNEWKTDIAIGLTNLYPDEKFTFENSEEREENGKKKITCYSYTFIDHKFLNSYTYDKAMELAYKGNYHKAIEVLMPFALTNDEQALCNIGVCFERIGEYKEAKQCYELTNDIEAKKNLLKLYDTNKIKFDIKSYKDTCSYLIGKDLEEGYLYMSYLYQGLYSEKKDIKKAIEYLDDGLAVNPNAVSLVFEKAYLLNQSNLSTDLITSHTLYKSVVDDTSSFGTAAKYNYALQLRKGRGCDKNVMLAIKYLILAIQSNYKDAYKELINIYETENGWINAEQAEMWNDLLKRCN